MSAPTPSAAQVHALLARAANATLSPDEQRLIGQLLRQARASLAGVSRASSYRTACLDEVRDALTHAGHGRAQVDDWPDVMPALNDLITERDKLRAEVDEMRSIVNEIALQRDELRQRLTTLGRERDQQHARAAPADDPINRHCAHCGATPGRRCKGPYGRDYLIDGRPGYHAPRRTQEQQ